MTTGADRIHGRVRALTASAAARLDATAAAAEQLFSAHPEVATLSVVSRAFARPYGVTTTGMIHAACVAPPICFLNDDVAELLDFDRASGSLSTDAVAALAAAATRRGLRHLWQVTDDEPAASTLARAVTGDRLVLAPCEVTGEAPARPIAVGIDAAWLLGGESGAQVFVFETVKALARRSEIGRIVLLSDSGTLPQALGGVPKVEAGSWTDAVAQPRLDILHRPYQPGADTDFARYRSVARAVVLTILDFIAYDNPSYHESSFAFRSYQRAFDARVCDADQVIAISRYIGDRLQQQFAHRLLAPVRTIHLGTDHLGNDHAIGSGAAGFGLPSKGYLLVLGNDFAHKNRDFAVKVFAEMCRRGYQGSLVLAGYHLDSGSSFDYELAGAGASGARIVRTGPVPTDQKVALMRHAAAVLYPTSCEGFGLIPFEAAALGTPTAFVRFGPLSETLPAVTACPSWRVGPFADLVLSLIANPREQLEQIAAAQRQLTWQRCAAETTATYCDMLDARAPWHAAMAAPAGPGPLALLNETTREFVRRASGRIRRLSRRSGEPPPP